MLLKHTTPLTTAEFFNAPISVRTAAPLSS